jgi:TRAP-type mannitol/chloroaromatic compound transport system substrate-binding protein
LAGAGSGWNPLAGSSLFLAWPIAATAGAARGDALRIGGSCAAPWASPILARPDDPYREYIDMSVSRGLKLALVALAAGGFTFAAVASAEAQERVRWKMQSAFGSKLPLAGTSGPRFEENVKRLSQGTLQIKFYEPGALVPALECFDSVSKGALESCWTTPGYHTGKYPALAFFTTVPYGPGIGEFMAWKWFGGGNDMRNEIYKGHNLFALDSFSHGPETSGWFRQPITSLDQLKGLKMRFFGLGAQVIGKLGVSTQLLAAADIYPALERGVIDATEFSMPTMDISLGFYQIAKNNYFPGWHQQVSVSELLMNKASFDGLADHHKAMIEIALGESVMYVYAESEYKNPFAMQELVQKHGVKVHRWPDEFLKAFEVAWLEVVEEQSAKDPLFKKVADSYFDFRKQYKLWGDAQALKASYVH